MKVTVKRKLPYVPVVIETEFIKLESAMKLANILPTGGAAKAGESSRQAIARELFEETGIKAEQEDFEFIGSDRDWNAFYDFYCLKRQTPIGDIVLLPGETVDAKWVTLDQVHQMIERKQICHVIAGQFLRQEPELIKRQNI